MVKRTLLVPVLALWDALFVQENVLVLLIHGTSGTARILVLTLLMTFYSTLGTDWILCIARWRHITRQLQLPGPDLLSLLLTLKSRDYVLRGMMLRL